MATLVTQQQELKQVSPVSVSASLQLSLPLTLSSSTPPTCVLCYPLSFNPFGSLLPGLHWFYCCIIIITRHYYCPMLVVHFFFITIQIKKTKQQRYDHSLSYISILKCANVFTSKYMSFQVGCLEL